MSMLKEYYIKYLKEIRKSSDSSVKHYLNALNQIEKYLRDRNKLDKAIYNVINLEELEEIRSFLFQDSEFKEKDIRGHQMYSAGLNNYFKFALGEGFDKEISKNVVFDYVLPKGEMVEIKRKLWQRSTILKGQSIQMANYKCEIDEKHKTFIARVNNKPYMEGHHIIPMCNQEEFDNSLDVYANIICVCPTCHKMLHYGKDDERIMVLDKIYDSRHDRLKKCGINLSKEEFVSSII